MNMACGMAMTVTNMHARHALGCRRCSASSRALSPTSCHQHILRCVSDRLHCVRHQRVVAARASSGISTPAPEQGDLLPEDCRKLLSDVELQYVETKLQPLVDRTEQNLQVLQQVINWFEREDWKELGIEDLLIRGKLMQGFAMAHKKARDVAKSIVVLTGMDPTDAKYELIAFKKAAEFEVYTKQCALFYIEDSHKRFVASYDDIINGKEYYTTKSLNQQVDDLEGWKNNLVRGVQRAGKLASLALMKQHNGKAAPLPQGKYEGKEGRKRQLDAVVVADSCVLVTETKTVVDLDAAKQLESTVNFIKEAVDAGVPQFDFAQGKEVKGALAGLVLPMDTKLAVAVKKKVKAEGWELLLLNGKPLSDCKDES